MIHIHYFDCTGHDELYRNVAKFFGEASRAVAQRLANDSSNLFPIIKNAYAEIAKKASISRIAPDDINVKVYAVFIIRNHLTRNLNPCGNN